MPHPVAAVHWVEEDRKVHNFGFFLTTLLNSLLTQCVEEMHAIFVPKKCIRK